MSIVPSLVGIEYHLSDRYATKCHGGLIQTVDARSVLYTTFDVKKQPVIVVTSAGTECTRHLARPGAHPSLQHC